MEILSKFKKQDKDTGEYFIYTEDQLMARLRFFIGICLALTLTGIVFVVLYSIIFVTQPLNAMSPIDQKFFELIIPIATFLTGTLSGIMLAGNDKDAKMKALEAATKAPTVSPNPTAPSSPTGGLGGGGSFGGSGGFGGGFSASANIGGFSASYKSPTPAMSPMPTNAMGGFGAPASTFTSSSGKLGPAPMQEPEL